jgi:hypothetical protein
MSTIRITDVVGPVTYLCICDDSSLANARPTELLSSSKSPIGDFTKPINVTAISLVAQLAKAPSLIDGLLDLTVNGHINNLSTVLTPANQLLFPIYSFAFTPPLPPPTAVSALRGSTRRNKRAGSSTTIRLNYYLE